VIKGVESSALVITSGADTPNVDHVDVQHWFATMEGMPVPRDATRPTPAPRAPPGRLPSPDLDQMRA